ncbi:MAG TPA: hypothetical protein VIM75_00485 [Ohtaekwangia sp.]|uniref:hypothetical protein n=1 Tax=Ohtaekwangia sp. TaxID=2066019 RepID=UPI002F94D258
MKPGIIGVILMLLAISALAWLKHSIPGPDVLIVGIWNEQTWEYEKVYSTEDLEKVKQEEQMSQTVKDQLGRHLIIHSAEKWLFRPDGTLILKGDHADTAVKWKIKGRGHILELEYNDRIVEHYNLTELTRDQMVLNFDSDMQVRGVAKLIFKR